MAWGFTAVTFLTGRTEIKKQDGAVRTYYYDPFEHILSETDENGAETSYLYEKGRLIKKIETDGKATAYAYDTEGNVTETDRAGQKELSSYDAAGQLLSVSGAVSANTVYTYDKRGTGSRYVGTKGESCIKYFEWKIESKLIQFWLGYLKID